MYTYKTLSVLDWPKYRHLTFPSYRDKLNHIWSDHRWRIVGVEILGHPVGLAVLFCDWKSLTAHMLSIFVVREHRRRGLATRLMEHMLSFCKQHQIRLIQFVYYTGTESIPVIESWLAGLGCTRPKSEALVFHIDRRIGEAPWVREGSLPAGLRIVPWLEIPETERNRLRDGDGSSYPEHLSPFKTFAPLEPLNSLGLVDAEGRIQGWSISYRLKADVVLYDAIYVAPEYRQSGLAIVLLSRAIRKHLAHVDAIPIGMFAVYPSNQGMYRLANKWLRPYASKTSEKRSCVLVVRP